MLQSHSSNDQVKAVNRKDTTMAITIIVATIASICAKYHITEEQFSKATYCTSNGKGFYLVESASTPGQEYRIEWNDEYQCLQCKPHNGEACKASVNGLGCWHKRAALANQEHYKATETARRQREQVEVERSQAYRLERAMHELETLQADLEIWQSIA